jgi:hypothetical protein
MNNSKHCFQCGDPTTNDMFGYAICDSCKSALGLFTDETIKKHIAKYETPTSKRSYKEEIDYRLDFIEKDFIKKKIKLLEIKARLENI